VRIVAAVHNWQPCQTVGLASPACQLRRFLDDPIMSPVKELFR
jgi:hypothetical protein